MNNIKKIAFFSAMFVALLFPINQKLVAAKNEEAKTKFQVFSTDTVKKTQSPVTLYVDYDDTYKATVKCPITQTKSGTVYTYELKKCILYVNSKQVASTTKVTKDNNEFMVEFSDIQLKNNKKNTVKVKASVTQTNSKGKTSKLTKSPSVTITPSNSNDTSSTASGIKSYEVIYENDDVNSNVCVGVIIQAKNITIPMDDIKAKYKNATITETPSGSYIKYKISNLVVNKKTKDATGNLVIKYRSVDSSETNNGTVHSLEIPYSTTSINKKSGDIMSLKRNHFKYATSLTINNAIDYSTPVAIIETANDLSSFSITVNKKTKQTFSEGLAIPSGKKTITSESISIPNLKTGDVVELAFEIQGATYTLSITIPEGFVNKSYSFDKDASIVYNTLLQKGKIIVYVNENGEKIEEHGTFSLVKKTK